MTATKPSVSGLYVGASGWSYPTWRPGFYPAGTKPAEFLAHYATRFRTVELNTTGYRIPGADQFRRWAEQTPPGFRFAVKLDAHRRGQASAFEEGIERLGDRLGPIRVVARRGGAARSAPGAVRGRAPLRVRLPPRELGRDRAPRPRGARGSDRGGRALSVPPLPRPAVPREGARRTGRADPAAARRRN